MALVYYYVMFAISLLLVIVYSYIFHKHFDANMTIMSALVPVINLGFVLMGRAQVVEEALAALKLTYIGGCFLLVSAMFLIIHICGIELKPWMRAIIITFSCLVFGTVITIGTSINIFYEYNPDLKIPDLAYYGGATYITNKHYGFMHTIFYIMVGFYYLVTISVIVFSFFKKKQVPRSILFLIILAVTIAIIGFFGGRIITHKIELLPLTYNIGMIIYIIIASRLRMYDASDSVIDSLVQKGETGFISFDGKMRYLGSNETAKRMIPELNELRVDHHITHNLWLSENFLSQVKTFKQDESKNKVLLERDGKFYLIQINHLIIGRFHQGYQFLITDDTANQQYIKLIQNYNIKLEEEVANKTKDIVEMQEKLVLGMATMIEGRDNSTGGHIKRTSDCIRILADELKKDNILGLSDNFYSNLIKAAPMHDLGKIVVDDSILRKPGKYTPEEYNIMKTHAAEGARIVKQILEGTNDQEFTTIAINVAHFHHERWDGSGYPNQLKGKEIPIEARIMAVADVYDALVSKRVYKEKMSFEEADKIIMEGMGKHFDPELERFYIAAKDKLERYYKEQSER